MTSQERIKVLVVEDDSTAKDLYMKRLGQLGYTIIGIASSRIEAMDLLGDSEKGMPDVVLMDIILDESGAKYDGISIAQEINASYAIPIIYISQVTDFKIIKRALKTDCANYLVKTDFFNPIYISQMQASIYQAVSDYRQKLEKMHAQSSKAWGEIVMVKQKEGALYPVRFTDILIFKILTTSFLGVKMVDFARIMAIPQ